MLKKCLLILLGLPFLLIITLGEDIGARQILFIKQNYKYVPQINNDYSVTQQIYSNSENQFRKVQQHDFFIQQVKKSKHTPNIIISHTYNGQALDRKSENTKPQNNQLKPQNSSQHKNNYIKRSTLFYVALVDGILLICVIGMIICYCKTNNLDCLKRNLTKMQQVRAQQDNALSGEIINQRDSMAPKERESDQSSSEDDLDDKEQD